MTLYAVLGFALANSHGHYVFTDLVMVTIAFVFLSVALLGRTSRNTNTYFAPAAAWAVAVIFASKLLDDLELIYPTDLEWLGVAQFFVFVGGTGVLASGIMLALVSRGRLASLAFWLTALLSAAALLAAAVFVLPTSPAPYIDVFTLLTQASDFIRRGLNPYPQEYVDIYAQVDVFHGADYPPGLTYPPGILWWVTPAWLLGGDVRLAMILADALAIAGLFLLARRLRVPPTTVALLVLAWMTFPVRLFVLEQSWTDPVIFCYLTFLLLTLLHRRWIMAGFLVGLLCALKQTVLFMVVLTGVATLSAYGWRAAAKMVGVSITVYAIQVLPFALHDWDSFYLFTIKIFATTSLREDALTWVAAASRAGFRTPEPVMAAISLTTLVVLSLWLARTEFRIWRLCGAMIMQYGVTFLFGKWAFCNYYYLLAFLCVLLMLTLLANEERSDSKSDGAGLERNVDKSRGGQIGS